MDSSAKYQELCLWGFPLREDRQRVNTINRACGKMATFRGRTQANGDASGLWGASPPPIGGTAALLCPLNSLRSCSAGIKFRGLVRGPVASGWVRATVGHAMQEARSTTCGLSVTF